MPKANIQLLKRLRTRFLRMRHSEHFDMRQVAERNECGTAMCIAGHALDLQGYEIEFDSEGDLLKVRTPGGRVVRHSMRAAAREMGLDYEDEAYPLFNDFSLTSPKQAAYAIEDIIAAHA